MRSGSSGSGSWRPCLAAAQRSWQPPVAGTSPRGSGNCSWRPTAAAIAAMAAAAAAPGVAGPSSSSTFFRCTSTHPQTSQVRAAGLQQLHAAALCCSTVASPSGSARATLKPQPLLPHCCADKHLPELFQGHLITDRILPEWGTHQASIAMVAALSALLTPAFLMRIMRPVPPSPRASACPAACLQLVEATRNLLWEAFRDPLNQRWVRGGGACACCCFVLLLRQTLLARPACMLGTTNSAVLSVLLCSCLP